MKRWTGNALLCATALSWLVLTGCPVGLWNYGVMRYLPVAEGNEWTYGCALPETVPDGKVLNENASVKVRITDVLSVDDHTVWQVQKEIRANANDEPALEDLFFVFYEDVLFAMNTIDNVYNLEAATANREVSAPFLHESLRPRTITDETDPLRQFYGADVRYERGALADFMPVVYEYEDDPATCNCVPQRHRVTVALEDFGEAYRDVEDCIALEVDRGDGEEPVWVPAIIVGRRLGPLLVQQGAVYVVAKDAALDDEEE